MCHTCGALQVGFQQALVRDVARVFCVLSVEWATKLLRTRAVATGNALSSKIRPTPEDMQGICPLLFGEIQQPGAANGDLSAVEIVRTPSSTRKA